MIIQCEECRTKFNIDETLLKNEGSKVRCSLCKHIFVAYPPDQIVVEEPLPVSAGQEELEEQEEAVEAGLEDEFGFDEEIEDILEEGEAEEVNLGKDLEESLEEADEVDLDKAIGESLEELGLHEEIEDSLKVEDAEVVHDKDLGKFLEGIEEGEAIYDEDLHGLARQEMTTTKEPSDRIQVDDEPLFEDTEDELEEELVEQDKTIPAASETKRSGRSRALLFFLVIIFMLIGTAYSVNKWIPDLISDPLSILRLAEKQEVTDMGNVSLSFKPTLGFYITSEKAGKLFVIQGIVENDYPTSRSFILIKGILWGDKGQIAKEQLAYAGNTIKREDLEVMTLEEISKAMKDREGTDRKNINLAPGASIPVTIVFDNLPENMSQYGGEVVSSSLGSP